MNKTLVPEASSTNTVFVPEEGNSIINVNIVVNEVVSMDSVFISEGLTMRNAIEELVCKAENIERVKSTTEIPFGKKMCPTRHGCTGATNCNYEYASYPG